jgi:VWFA-related protein
MPRSFRALALLALFASAPLLAQQPAPPQAPAPPAAAALPPASGGPEPSSQQPPVTFRAEVNYVEVDARVLDEQGNFVTGLQQGDFEVLEDGKPQKVDVFSLVNIPVARAERPLFASRPIEPDVDSNVRGYDGRIYLIVLDDFHTAAQRSVLTRRAARQFVERYVGANDTAAVVFTSARQDASQEFTNNKRLLLAAIDKFMGRKPRSSTLERLDEEARTRDTRQAGDPIMDPQAFERGYNSRVAVETIRNLAQYMSGISGRRKAMVLFSEGIDVDITDPFGNGGVTANAQTAAGRDSTVVLQTMRDAIGAATRANVAIYGVDPRGLTSLADDAIEVQDLPRDNSMGLMSFQNELRLQQDSLRIMAGETGGFAVVNSNDFNAAFDRIVQDNSSYYVLGYYSANTRRDGRFRRIEVKVNRPGVTVRARKGYAAAKGKAPENKDAPGTPAAALRAAISSPLPVAGLPMEATAAVFKGAAPNGAVVISTLIGTRTLELTEKEGTFQNTLELVITAVDYKGKSFDGGRHTVGLKLKPENVQRVRATGFRALNQIDLPPGRYKLRIAVAETGSSRAGSVMLDLEVPDYAKEKFAMSSLALTSATSTIGPTARQKDPLEKMLPGPLTTFRDFPVGDEVALFAEIYDSTGKTPHKVDIAATVKAEGGQTVFETREERDSSELAGSPGGYGFSARIPLKDVAPGLYVLRVEATNRMGDRLTTSREVVFRVLGRSGAPSGQ